jgi:hypothetical protein
MKRNIILNKVKQSCCGKKKTFIYFSINRFYGYLSFVGIKVLKE